MNVRQHLPKKGERGKGVSMEIVPWIQWQLCVSPSGKQIDERTIENLADRVKDPGKKRPFCAKDLVRATELVRQNVLLPGNNGM